MFLAINARPAFVTNTSGHVVTVAGSFTVPTLFAVWLLILHALFTAVTIVTRYYFSRIVARTLIASFAMRTTVITLLTRVTQ